jgi:diguanylate cyclase (GGDEF)-like protein
VISHTNPQKLTAKSATNSRIQGATVHPMGSIREMLSTILVSARHEASWRLDQLLRLLTVLRPWYKYLRAIASRPTLCATIGIAFAIAIQGDLIRTLFSGLGWSYLLLRRSTELRDEIARREQAESEIARLARHDTLTGLPNRRLFTDAVAQAFGNPVAGGGFAILLLGLDEFKRVNDAYGHALANLVLVQVAERLKKTIGSDAILARLESDEFAVLLPMGTSGFSVERDSSQILHAMAEPLFLQDHSITLGASIGIALAPKDAADSISLMRAAELAMNRAKQANKGRLRFYETAMSADMQERIELRSELRAAIDDGELIPYYQTLVDLKRQEVSGLEVLARWHHPRHGILSPDKFIPIVEDLKLGSALTLSLLRQACVDAKAWPSHFKIAINVSPVQLLGPDLATELSNIVRATGLEPSRFEIEITEGALIEDLPSARRMIESLHEFGMTTALDDFGTGFSSLYHLRELYFDRIKIDQSFVRNVSTDLRAADYVNAIIKLAENLHVAVTAEGIETPEVLSRLVALGCASGQGHLFAGPLPADQVSLLLQRPVMTPPAAEPPMRPPAHV